MKDCYEWVTECCAAMRASRTHEELFHNFQPFLERVGFGGFIYLEANAKSGDFIIHGCTYPPEWAKEYVEKGYGAIDPILAKMFTEKKAYHWNSSELRKQTGSEQYAELSSFCEKNGMQQGVSVPFRKQDEVRLFSMTTSNRRDGLVTPALITAIQVVAENYNMMFVALYKHALDGLGALHTEKEQRALLLSAFGATSEQSAEILGLESKTIQSQILSAREKIRAGSLSVAISLAQDLGILHSKNQEMAESATPKSFSINKKHP